MSRHDISVLADDRFVRTDFLALDKFLIGGLSILFFLYFLKLFKVLHMGHGL